MLKLNRIIYFLALIIINSSFVYANPRDLTLIQIYQPKMNWIDINFHSFFFLDTEEEIAIRKACNKFTLYSYKELINNTRTIKNGDYTVLINAVHLKNEEKKYSTQGLIITIKQKNNTILDRVIFKEEDFSGMSIIFNSKHIILSTRSNSGSREENFEIDTNLKSSLTTYDAVKDKARALTSYVCVKKPYRILNLLNKK